MTSMVAKVSSPQAMYSHHAARERAEAQLESLLIERAKLSRAEFSRVRHLRSEQAHREPLCTLLVRLGTVSAYDMAEALAQVLELPQARALDYPETRLLEDRLSTRFLKEHLLVPLSASADRVIVAMADPQNGYAARAVELASGKSAERWVGVKSEILDAIERLYDRTCPDPGQVDEELATQEDFSDEDVEHLRDLASEAPVIRTVNQILYKAIEAGASDIHIEPFDGRLALRYRIDGMLRPMDAPAAGLAPAIVSRIKIMARLNIAERRLPQDGRIRVRIQGLDIDVRVSTVPTMHGESVVMRLLNSENITLDFEALGFDPAMVETISELLTSPHGMLLVTGPTGSGKTTTLYTALDKLNQPKRKIITVEDPVEYELPGINQIQVKPSIGLGFANALRSIVRQDPDVIMVGEMRDLETARICVQSALTGHLVLSTLHTNDAASSITRLLDMGAEEYLVASTLKAVLAQRLVRMLCDKCRAPYAPAKDLVSDLAPHGVGELKRLYRSAGCDHCNGSGFRGRTIISELLEIDDRIQERILGRSASSKIQEAARQQGMTTMLEHGLRKAVSGLTTVEEVFRVTRNR